MRPNPLATPDSIPEFATGQIAPAATLALLSVVDSAPIILASHPYTGCARIATQPTGGRYWAQQVGPWQRHAVVAVGGNTATGSDRAPAAILAATTAGGLTGSDRVRITGALWTLDASPMDSSADGPALTVSSQVINDAPSGQTARALELAEDTEPALDVCWIDGCTMWALCPFDFTQDIG